jgi:sulfane dehydrogenase subunit SoxC
MKQTDLDFVAGGGLLGRRAFLKSGLGFTAASALVALPGSRLLADEAIGARFPPWMKMLGTGDTGYGSPSPLEQSVQRRQFPTTPETAGFAIWRTPLGNQPGIITPSGLHFAVHHNGIPDIKPDEHQLMIHGLVEKPLKFSLERLMRYPMVSRIQFLECAGNSAANALSPTPLDGDCQELFGEISCSEWTGVPLSYLLREAGIKNTAAWVIAEGADGGSHSRSLPLAKLLDDAIVALYQNGERLRPSQGYPMRLFVPGWEGNVNVKWLHRLEVTDSPAYTKDESGLYTQILDNGDIERFAFPMDVKSVITHPSGLQVLPEVKGFYEIYGFAWSGYGKISRVEVSADSGKTWGVAQLDGPVLDKAMTRFSIPWQWNGKPTTLLSRATDEHGRTQPDRDTWKSRYAAHSFNHYNAIQAWDISSNGRVENTYV